MVSPSSNGRSGWCTTAPGAAHGDTFHRRRRTARRSAREKTALVTSDRDTLRADFVARAGWADARETAAGGRRFVSKIFPPDAGRRHGRSHGRAAAAGGREALRAHRPASVAWGSARRKSSPKTRPTASCCWRTWATTRSRACSRKGGDEAELYARATDVLVTVHTAARPGLLPGLGAYAGEALIEAAMLVPEWYLPEATGRPTTDEQTATIAPPGAPASPTCRASPTPCCCATTTRTISCGCRPARREGLRPARFPGRPAGHPSYDLVSLIEDARRDVSPAVHAACLARYIAATGLDDAGFPHRLRPDGGAAPRPHHRPVRPAAAARRQTRLPAASAARLADVRARPASTRR